MLALLVTHAVLGVFMGFYWRVSALALPLIVVLGEAIALALALDYSFVWVNLALVLSVEFGYVAGSATRHVAIVGKRATSHPE